MKIKFIAAALIIAVAGSFLAGCPGGGGGGSSATLSSIEVTPVNPSIALGTNEQFTATGIYSDNTKQNLTSSADWSSSDEGVASIDNAGRVTSHDVGGPVTLTATSGAVSGSATVMVTPAVMVSLEITPTNVSIAFGTNQQFTATGVFSDNTKQDLASSVTWSSSDTSIATISNIGLVTSQGTGGPVTISATFDSFPATTTLTVTPAVVKSISITPPDPDIAKGTSRQFTAMGTFTDDTTQDLTATAIWSSSKTDVATISNAAGSSGLAASIAAGQTTITASSDGVTGATTLTVTPAALLSISVSPLNPSIAKGTTQQFTATGHYTDGTTQDLTATAIWSSLKTDVATISNAAGSSGLATAVATGQTTILATSGGFSGSTPLTVSPAELVSITVTPTNPTMASALKFMATGNYTDGTTQNLTASATWFSLNTGVATISNAASYPGLASAVAIGSTSIKATLGGISGSTTLTVATDFWSPMSTGANVPSARYNHVAVWTGSEMVIWGGFGAGNTTLNTGGKYDPVTDAWTPTSSVNAPAARYGHTMVYESSLATIILWGGRSGGGFYNDGRRYNSSTDTWAAISTTNAPSARYGHVAVSGSSGGRTVMTIWGGSSSILLNTGGRYYPDNDTWTSTSVGAYTPTPRIGHTAVWSIGDMIVWGGHNGMGTETYNTGAIYTPSSDFWLPITTGGAPQGRYGHTAVFNFHAGVDGSNAEMIVWGGRIWTGTTGAYTNTGGVFDYFYKTWRPISTANAPTPRSNHTAVWTGSPRTGSPRGVMVVWGGYNGAYLNTGDKYNPWTDTWTPVAATGAPIARSMHTAVWAENGYTFDSAMIIWGGATSGGAILNAGGLYRP